MTQRDHERTRAGDRPASGCPAPAPSLHPLDPAGPRVRPGGWDLVRYTLARRVDQRHSTWVLNDLTCSTWWLRHFARTLVVVVPLLAVYLLLAPGSWGVVLLTGLTFAGGILLYSLINILVVTDRRAVRAGYPTGYVSDVREKRSVERNRAANRQRRERIAQRQSRRR